MRPLLALLCLALGGCSNRPPAEIRIPDAAPVIEGARFTEATVLGEAADVRFQLAAAVTASLGLPSEPAVRAAAAQVETSLAAVEAAIAAHPAAEIEKLVADFHAAIEQLRAVIADRNAEIKTLRDADARFWNRILVGLGIASSLLAVGAGFFSASIPFIGPALGPRIGIMAGACAATCFTLAYLAAWTREHPVITACIVATTLAVGVGLAWANLVNHRKDKATP